MPKTPVNGINISYRVEGKGEPLVLIMGIGSSRRIWLLQTRAFRKHYTVISFDNRGAGKTDKPSTPYTIEMMADDTVALMDRLDIEKAHVLGFSMGGMIAQWVAIKHPERVDKLILASTVSSLEGELADMPLGARGREIDAKEHSATSVNGVELQARIVASSFNRKLCMMAAGILAGPYARWIGAKGLEGQAAACVGCNTVERLHTIQAPTLVITGTGDRVLPSSASDLIAARIPNARLVKVEGGSHMYIWEMPRRFNREVLAFLERG